MQKNILQNLHFLTEETVLCSFYILYMFYPNFKKLFFHNYPSPRNNNPVFTLVTVGNSERTIIRLVSTGDSTRDLPNASTVCFPGMGGSPDDVGEAMSEGLENEQSLIRKHLHRFTCVTAHSPILPESLHLCHRHFTYVTWRVAHPRISISTLNFLPQMAFIIEALTSSECSAQRQVLRCKRRNLGCSSAEGRSCTANSGTMAAVLLGI